MLNTRSCSFAAAMLLASIADGRAPLDTPNLVVVFLDDCGYGDFSHTGNPTIHTPHVTRMVREGLNFPQFYTASPACSASRYALLTGRNPARSGFGTWVLSPRARRFLHPAELTIAEGLRGRGYATGFFGKWHLGNPNEANGFSSDAFPLAHGFETWEGTSVSNDYDPGANLVESDPEGTTPVDGYRLIAADILKKKDIHRTLTRRYRDRAVQFIKNKRDHSFFLYVAPNMPHLPVFASEEFQGKSLRGLYGDCIEEIDAMVGSILNVLEEEGIAENTLVVFTSDNGPWIRFANTTSHEKYGEARLLVGSALPFRDGKGSTWEGGVRVPGVFWWPGTIPAASVVRQPASTMDILPTIFALAGAAMPTDRSLDGRDVRPWLNATAFAGAVPEFRFIYTGASDNRIYGARRGAWKLHIRLFSQTGDDYGFKASRAEPLLFNVELDPGERFHVGEDHADRVAELQDQISTFQGSLAREGTYWGDR